MTKNKNVPPARPKTTDITAALNRTMACWIALICSAEIVARCLSCVGPRLFGESFHQLELAEQTSLVPRNDEVDRVSHHKSEYKPDDADFQDANGRACQGYVKTEEVVSEQQ